MLLETGKIAKTRHGVTAAKKIIGVRSCMLHKVGKCSIKKHGATTANRI